MNDKEYAEWIWTDTFKQILPAVTIYAVLLIAFWVFV